MTNDVFVRSVYFFGPDGVCLEFAAWTATFDEKDVAHEAARADGSRTQGLVLQDEKMPAENGGRALEEGKKPKGRAATGNRAASIRPGYTSTEARSR